MFSVLLLLCSTGYTSCAHEKNYFYGAYLLTRSGNKEYFVHAFDSSKNTHLKADIVLQTESLDSIEKIKKIVRVNLTRNYYLHGLPKSDYEVTDLYFVNPTDKSKIAITDERCIETTLEEKGYHLEAAILPITAPSKTYEIECHEKDFEGQAYQFKVLIKHEEIKKPEEMRRAVANVRKNPVLLQKVHQYQGDYEDKWKRIGDCDVDLYCVDIHSGERLDIHNPNIEKGLKAGTHTLKADIQRKELNS